MNDINKSFIDKWLGGSLVMLLDDPHKNSGNGKYRAIKLPEGFKKDIVIDDY